MIQMGRMHEVDTTRAWLRSCSSTCPACSSRTSQSSGLNGSMSTRDAEGMPFLSRTSTKSEDDIPSDCASADGTCQSTTSAQHDGRAPRPVIRSTRHLGSVQAALLRHVHPDSYRPPSFCVVHTSMPHSRCTMPQSHISLPCSPHLLASTALCTNRSPQCPRAMHSYRRPS